MVYIIFIIISIFFIVISNQRIFSSIPKVKSNSQTSVSLNTWMKQERSVHPYKELVRTCPYPFILLSYNSLLYSTLNVLLVNLMVNSVIYGPLVLLSIIVLLVISLTIYQVSSIVFY